MGTGKRAVSILVACGRSISGELISQALENRAGFRVVGTATSSKRALEVLLTNGIDFALITTALADGPLAGLLLVQKIQEDFPQIKTVLLFERSEDHLIESAFRAGVKGVFSLSDGDVEMLCRCVERVHAGQVWASSAQLVQVIDAFSRQAPLRVVNAEGARLLTKREEDVVRLVEEGLTNKQIAHELHLSEHTVRNNLFRIFDKLGVSTRVELALYAVNNSKRVVAGPESSDGETEADLPEPRTPSSRVQ